MASMTQLQAMHLQPVHILMLVLIGLLVWPAAAELTAYQNLASSANVGQTVMVTVSLTYKGDSATQAVVTPSLPFGVVANSGGQSAELYPGVTQQISYPLTAQQSGSYWIVSDISWAEDGTWRSLRLEAPFTAIGVDTGAGALPQGSVPGAGASSGPNGSDPLGSDPFAAPPAIPAGEPQGYPEGRIMPPGPYNDTQQQDGEMAGDYPGDMSRGRGMEHMPGGEDGSQVEP